MATQPRDNYSDLDPEMLAELESERQFASGNFTERLKLDKGAGAVIRFLPAKLGKNKNWFARVGMHWFVGGRPVNCPRHSAPAVGGDPAAPCIVCDTIEKLIDENAGSKETVDKLSSARVWPKYLTYVLVLENIDRHGESVPLGRKARQIPHEFWINKTGFSELTNLFRRSLKWSPTMGFVDPVNGCDIEVRTDNRGYMKFDLVGRGPVRDDLDNDQQAEWIEKLVAGIRLADMKPSTEDKLEEFTIKLEDAANGGGRRRRQRVDDDELEPRRRGMVEDDDPPARRRGLDDDDPPARSRRSADDEPPPRRRESVDELPPRSRRAEQDESSSRRREPVDDLPPRRNREEDQDDGASRRRAEPLDDLDGTDDGTEGGVEHEAPPVSRGSRQAPAASADEAPPPPARQTANRLAPPPAASQRKLAPPPAADKAGDEDLPPERGHVVDPATDDLPLPPPADDKPITTKSTRLSDDMRQRLRNVDA